VTTISDNKLIVVTAPSGSGKTTVVRHLLDKHPELAFSVSATTRSKRPNEKFGVHYYYLSVDTFKLWTREDAFVEWEEVYQDQFYGTPRFEIERLWGQGKHVVFDIDVKGAMNIKRQYGEKAVVIFIKAPSMDVIVNRLTNRATESEQSLQKRILRIGEEMKYADRADYVLVNDDLETAFKDADRILAEIIG
jgi:guanylate kinase